MPHDPTPLIEPVQFRLGDSIIFDKAIDDHSAGDGWVLTYKIHPQSSGTVITWTGTASGSTHQIRVNSATTAAYAAGDFWAIGYVTKSPDRYEVYAGAMTILANPDSTVAYDGRTYLQRILDLLETSIEANEAPRNVIRYSYGGVTSEIRTLDEALKARAILISAIAAEEARLSGKQRRVLTRFRLPR